MIEMVENIAKQEGIGADLARGVKYCSEKYGGTDFAMQVKGTGVPAVRAARLMGNVAGLCRFRQRSMSHESICS